MKKLVALMLCIILILTSTITAFANVVPVKDATTTLLKLNIASSPDDLEYIKKYQSDSKASFTKEDNNFVLEIYEVDRKADKVLITGKAVAKMFGETYELAFDSREFHENEINGTKFYLGCIEDEYNETDTVLVDITTTADFQNAVVSVTVYTGDTAIPKVMLYGDTFEEQINLFNQYRFTFYNNMCECRFRQNKRTWL